MPILGHLLQEASERRATFALPGMRALILYPMNALVNDQIARLQRLFGDQRLSEWFDRHYGRHPYLWRLHEPYPLRWRA